MNEKKFDGMGKIYAKFRPTYPNQLFDYLYTNTGFTSQSVIADIGAGTGIFSKKLLEKNSTVIAIEPNLDMSKTATQILSSFPNFSVINAPAERTTLKDNSVDFITVAQAFHWFDKLKFKTECKRILKENGLVVLVWNSRDFSSEIVKGNEEINKKYCPNFKGFAGGYEKDNFSDFYENSYEILTFDNHLSFEKENFIGRNLSSSYAPKEKDINYHDYIEALTKLFDKYSDNGILTLPNYTDCYIGQASKK